ncbi:hypothetical protein [Mesorhizobium sp. B2-4-15]|uniref:hypothetical protein n=1 Tax=Mesorhizobium sp. B2-4-15 TaxID=2589934 RepID=UPI001FEDBE27|nr:hypothetical protein [Mesorhizobium sp. B2-4-15]
MADFTYIDDIVEGVVRLLAMPPHLDPDWDSRTADPAASSAPGPIRTYNVGNDRPEEINRLMAIIETALGRRALRVDVPLPQGDVLETHADVSDLRRAVGLAPATALEDGMRPFRRMVPGSHEGPASRERQTFIQARGAGTTGRNTYSTCIRFNGEGHHGRIDSCHLPTLKNQFHCWPPITPGLIESRTNTKPGRIFSRLPI